MKTRSRDNATQTLMAAIVAIFTIPGLIIYLFLRPKETLTEAYERSLEEEALLQEIETKPKCPGCSLNTEDKWLICPNCHTTLKKKCHHCAETLELTWQICPYCTRQQHNNTSDYTAIEQQNTHEKVNLRRQSNQRQQIEFIDEEQY